MSTIDYIQTLQQKANESLSAEGLRIAIVVAEWNSNITYALLEGAVDFLEKNHAEQIEVIKVPGTFELTNAVARLKQDKRQPNGWDAIIAIGCVVRGDTPHFDYVCSGVTQGLTHLNTVADHTGKLSPVIFCVLTTDTMAQAEARAGGSLGNKGEEAAIAAIEMSRLGVGDPCSLDVR